jgi:pimeloyl-ACP methyl ester carboxylesterase
MARTAPELHVTVWGEGPRAVLVHGGGAGGAYAFARQQPLAADYRLLLPDRPGTGASPADGPEDAGRDGQLIADLLGSGAHLVGHSYGAVAAMVAAARRPEAVRSLTLIEPPVFQLAFDDPVVGGSPAGAAQRDR